MGTVVAQMAALRFFYLRVLKRRNMKEDLPYSEASASAAHRPESRGSADG